ncbi:MAG: phosphoenolpyruvate--protein phosphotransferase [Gammaproteobacteria bacterium]|nr:phosphoenolpyruvate--protein phosphotransferase [Gammaproteobacteria bacterium]
MLVLHGTGVSSGIAIGKAYVLHRERPEVPEYVLPESLIEDEVGRFVAAINSARSQLERIRNQIPKSAPPEISSIIDTHLLILHDKMICEAPVGTIRKKRRNAEWALKTQSDELSAVFEQMDDPYLRSKKTDVGQVVDRILRNLLVSTDEEHEQITDALDGQIVVANDLAPADIVLLKHTRIAAFVTNLGGPISHTAILARSLEIPAIVAVHNATRAIRSGEELIVDGKLGVLVVLPEPAIVAEYQSRQKDIVHLKRELEAIKASRSRTLDGRMITLYANIELPDDVKAAAKVAAQGIGLYRTEFLFMNRSDLPDEEEQYRAYAKVVKAIPGRPVTIRTLDLGADKRVDASSRPIDTVTVNPALGLRAVRLCLHDTTLFRPQLRAILRASALGQVRIMIPMLSSLGEMFRVLDLIEETKTELTRQGQPFDPAVQVGGMIEVPAAAVSADLFAPHLDFFSIGTNDLIQYTLAIDRVDEAVNYLYDPLHPSVLRLISTTIRAGKSAGIPVAMCGEMAGDTRYTRLLLGLGLDEFSMHPSGLLEIKRIVRSSNLVELERFAEKVLGARDTAELHAIVDKMNER